MKPFSAISVSVLAVIALGHATRAIAGVTLTVGDFFIPMWFSWPVALLFGLLAFTLWGEASE